MLVPGEYAGIPAGMRAEYGRKEHVKRQKIITGLHPDFNGEYQLSYEFESSGYTIVLRGRPDAVYIENDSTIVEEIKTVAVDEETFSRLSGIDLPGFTAQLDIYCYLLYKNENKVVKSRLFLVNIATGNEKTIDRVTDFPALEKSLLELFTHITAEAERQRHHADNLTSSAKKLKFPYPNIRPHQNRMMDEVAAICETGGHLMLSAPTGSGKTAGVLFPALMNAFKTGKKVYFATARNTQKHIVREFVSLLKEKEAPFSALFITARRKICPPDEETCIWQDCRYMNDFEEKFRRCGLVGEMEDGAVISGEEIAERVLPLQICPFAAQVILEEKADFLIGDYNYVFDPSAILRNVFGDGGGGDFILIIDEAHNLPSRIRERFSPSITENEIMELFETIRGKSFSGTIHKRIAIFLRSLLKFIYRFLPEMESYEFDLKEIGKMQDICDRLLIEYYLHKAKFGDTDTDDPILKFLKSVLWFFKVVEMGPEGFAPLYNPDEKRLTYLCLDSAVILKEKMAEFHAVIAMSATLNPEEYFQNVLGLPENTTSVTLPSPFPAENRTVMIAANVSTKYSIRKRFYKQTAEIIEKVYSSKPGGYFCYFPSFQYMMDVAVFLKVPYRAQQTGMLENERGIFMEEVAKGREMLFLGVMGGIFAEGVDFPGKLNGVIIIGPGLPMFCEETELQRRYYDEVYGRGFDFTYVYPGMNRVIQAAGRLIRSETDVGVIVLVGSRFTQEPYRSLLPREWYVEHPTELIAKNIETSLKEFWER